ncbi:uncharacterized protein LOC134288800 [Aedes albopictus]|uniref:PHD-type domain-containing protein n=1 Tax=Aedes albopictus TaxID=7160 RepID=A0ABM2A0C8_AEDAL
MSAQEVSNCRGCTRPDEAEDMVACDECSQWWHYGCAGVAASVCNRSWRCVTCVKHSSYGSALPSGSVNTAGTSARLRLQQLTEAKALEDRLRKEQADKEREYLQMKHQLEAELEAEERSASSYASSGGSGYGHRRREDIRKWIVQQQNIQAPDVKHAVVASTPIDPASLRLDPTKAVQIRGDDHNQHIPPTVAEHQGYPWQYTLLENLQRLPTQTGPPVGSTSETPIIYAMQLNTRKQQSTMPPLDYGLPSRNIP